MRRRVHVQADDITKAIFGVEKVLDIFVAIRGGITGGLAGSRVEIGAYANRLIARIPLDNAVVVQRIARVGDLAGHQIQAALGISECLGPLVLAGADAETSREQGAG